MLSLLKEEMNVYGATRLGCFLSSAALQWFQADLSAKKAEDLEQLGESELIDGDLEVVRDLARFGGRYLELLESPLLNQFVDSVLNDKAVVHSYNAILTQPDLTPEQISGMSGYRFHRDQPYFKDTRTSVIVMIPLVDYAAENGSTQYVPSTHLFKRMPSAEFLESHVVSANGSAGEAYVVDATTWHRAGVNRSAEVRPLIVIRYSLAPFKQQIDYCESSATVLADASDLVRQRLGWNVRVCSDHSEFRVPGDKRKFRSGQYDMSNTDIHE